MVTALSELSVLLVYSAMALYTVAFIAFALDLSRWRRRQPVSSNAQRSELVAVGSGSSSVTPPTEPAIPAPAAPGRGARVGMISMTFGLGFHLLGDVTRGIAAGRVPWANMWEFSVTGTLVMVAVFVLVNIRVDLRFVGTFVSGLVLVLLGIAATRYYVAVTPLPPALQSYWLLIHVLVAILGTGFFAIGFALSALQLLHGFRPRLTRAGGRDHLRFLDGVPGADRLDNLAYRSNIVGFILWTFTLIAGAIWADKAWGRYWGWDTKEVWTFIIWVIYAGYLHARATRGWSGDRSAWLSAIGFAAVLFNFGVVNVFFKGLHAYSGL